MLTNPIKNHINNKLAAKPKVNSQWVRPNLNKVASPYIEEHIRQKEALRLRAYKDQGGKWTTGYGHLINLKTEKVLLRLNISEADALRLLDTDIEIAANCVRMNTRMQLTQYQFDALTDFVYNVGCKAFANSTLLKLINMNRFELVPDELRRWKYVEGKVSKGLVNRREETIQIWLRGEVHGNTYRISTGH